MGEKEIIKLSRRKILALGGKGVMALGFGGFALGQNCLVRIADTLDPLIGGPSPEGFIENYGYDTLPPPLGTSRYAVKLYDYSENNVNNPELVLNESDRRYAKFICSRFDKLEIVVGFEKKFKRVTLGSYHNKKIDVRGGAAVPLQLAGLGDIKYVINDDRSEEGYAIPNPRPKPGVIVGGGGIQIDTGWGDERLFKFEAWPSDGGSAEIEIDYLITNFD